MNIDMEVKRSGISISESTTTTDVEMISAALKQLQDSVGEQGLDEDVTAAAFHEACQHHASLVAQESNPLWFLR
jgi:hypothetical protein